MSGKKAAVFSTHMDNEYSPDGILMGALQELSSEESLVESQEVKAGPTPTTALHSSTSLGQFWNEYKNVLSLYAIILVQYFILTFTLYPVYLRILELCANGEQVSTSESVFLVVA